MRTVSDQRAHHTTLPALMGWPVILALLLLALAGCQTVEGIPLDAYDETDGAEDTAIEDPAPEITDDDTGTSDPLDDSVADAPIDTGPVWPDIFVPDEPIDLESYWSPVRIRIMAANLTSGNYQSYDPGHGVRIFQGLQPDIVLIQELNYGEDEPDDFRELVTTTFGPEFWFTRGNGSIPNGVVSRFPIVAAGSWDSPAVTNRAFDWAEIDLPGETDLLAVSVHLHTDDHNSELDDIAGDIRDATRGRDLYVVLGGDFNTNNRSATEGAFAHLLAVGDPYPADQDGLEGTNSARTKPYDWVLVDEALDAFEVSVQIGSRSHRDGLVFDSRVYTPLADVAPVLEDDSGATNMQHMAVVRDFSVSF